MFCLAYDLRNNFFINISSFPLNFDLRLFSAIDPGHLWYQSQVFAQSADHLLLVYNLSNEYLIFFAI